MMKFMKSFSIFLFTIILFVSSLGYVFSSALQDTMKHNLSDVLIDNETVTTFITDIFPEDALKEAGVSDSTIQKLKDVDSYKSLLNEHGIQVITSLLNDTESSVQDIQNNLQKQVDLLIETNGLEVPEEVRSTMHHKINEAIQNETISKAYHKVLEKVPNEMMTSLKNINYVFDSSFQTLMIICIITSFIMIIILKFHLYSWLLLTSIPVMLAGFISKLTSFLLPIFIRMFTDASSSKTNEYIQEFVIAMAKHISPLATAFIIMGIVLFILYFTAKMIDRQYHPDEQSEYIE